MLFCVEIFRHNNYFFTSDKWFYELFLDGNSIRNRISFFSAARHSIQYFRFIFVFSIINICLNWWLNYSERTYHTFRNELSAQWVFHYPNQVIAPWATGVLSQWLYGCALMLKFVFLVKMFTSKVLVKINFT